MPTSSHRTDRGSSIGRMVRRASVVSIALAITAGAPARADVPCPGDLLFPNGIGRVASVFRDVERISPMSNRPDAHAAERGAIVCRFDEYQTGARGRARIEFFDEENGGPSVINIGVGTHIQINEFHADRQAGREAGLIELIEGTIRSFMKEVSGETAFSVRTGTSVCGIRGSVVFTVYERELAVSSHMVEEGLLECPRPDGTRVPIETGQMVTINQGQLGPVGELDRDRLAELTDLVDAQDGYVPPRPSADPIGAADSRLPSAENLPAQCRAAVIAGPDTPRSRYRMCDPNASAVYSSCSVTLCITPTRLAELQAERPEHTFEQLDQACQPGCNEESGLARLNFYNRGDAFSFCGRCPDGLRWDRGRGCCH